MTGPSVPRSPAFCLLVLVSLVAACSRSDVADSQQMASPPPPFPPRPAGAKFLDEVRLLQAGDSWEHVVQRLGATPHEMPLRALGRHTPVRGVEITYYLTPANLPTVQPYDARDPDAPCVRLYFDTQRRLVSIQTNVPGLSFGALSSAPTP